MKEVQPLTEQLISFETAKLAKEKGLTEGGLTWMFYEENGRMFNNEYEVGEQDYICCTLDFLHTWLRKNHKMYVEVYIGHDEDSTWWNSDVFKIEKGYDFEPLNNEDLGGDSYEEAYEVAIREALKMIK